MFIGISVPPENEKHHIDNKSGNQKVLFVLAASGWFGHSLSFTDSVGLRIQNRCMPSPCGCWRMWLIIAPSEKQKRK